MERLSILDPRWGDLLFALEEWDALRILAEANDGAVPRYMEFLSSRERLGPNFNGARASERGSSGGIRTRHGPLLPKGARRWKASPAFATAASILLDTMN